MYYVQNKGFVDSDGKKVCSKREMALRLAKVAGYHSDSGEFTRLIIEYRVSREAMNAAYRAGMAAKQAGVRCSCMACAGTVFSPPQA